MQMTPALRPRKSSAVPLSPCVDRKSSKEVHEIGRENNVHLGYQEIKQEEDDDVNLLRMAERKKIRKMEDVDSNGDHHQPVTGSELSSVGVRNTLKIVI